MKTTKKVLGVVLALAMMLNVFAVVSFAAVPADTAAALYISADKASYKAGDLVTFTVSEEVLGDVGDMRIGGQYAIHYDASVFAPLAQTSEPSDVNITAIAAGYDASISGVVFTDDNVALGHVIDAGFDGLIKLNVADDGVTSFTATSKTDLFTFQMKVLDTAADGDYTVGFNVGSIESYDAFINDNTNGGMYGSDGSMYGVTNMFYYGSCSVKIGEAASAIIKSNNKTLVGWGNYNPATDTCDGAFVDDGNGKASWNVAVEAKFTAEDLAAAGLTFDAKGTCAEIKALEATVKIGEGAAATKSTQFIYGAADGTGDYVYRVVITGIDFGAADDVTVTFGGTLADDTAISGETVNFNLATVFAAAQGRGLPEAPTAA